MGVNQSVGENTINLELRNEFELSLRATGGSAAILYLSKKMRLLPALPCLPSGRRQASVASPSDLAMTQNAHFVIHSTFVI